MAFTCFCRHLFWRLFQVTLLLFPTIFMHQNLQLKPDSGLELGCIHDGFGSVIIVNKKSRLKEFLSFNNMMTEQLRL